MREVRGLRFKSFFGQLKSGAYEIQSPDAQGHYWIDSIGLSLGVWYGKRLEITTHWLRWWDKEGNLLLWGSEQIAQERQKTEQESQRAQSAEQEVAKLREILRKAGISEEEDGQLPAIYRRLAKPS